MNGRRAVALLAAVAAAPAAAESLNWIEAKLPNTGNDPWPYWVDNRPRGAGVPTVAEADAVIRASFQKWQDVSCAFIAFAYQGPAAAGPASNDKKNVMATFVENTSQDNGAYNNALGGGVALAVALPLMYNGVIYDCDVAFNAKDFPWSATGLPVANKYDLGTVALQEVGHCLGLDHYTGNRSCAMYPQTVPGEIRSSLCAHDQDNLCQLYPQAGGVGASCATASCATGLTCVTDPGTGDKFCTRVCDPSQPNCPTGYYCRTSTNPSPGACFPGNPPQGTPLIGAPCGDDAACGFPRGVCFLGGTPPFAGGYCSQVCIGTSARACPDQSTCYDDSCRCDAPAGCTDRSCCTDWRCFCLKDCRPGFGDCRQGYTCEPLTGGLGRCRPACTSNGDCQGDTCRLCDGLCLRGGKVSAKIGDGCAQAGDCPVGTFCLRDDFGFPGGYCTATCYTKCTTCPSGTSCLPYGTAGELLCLKNCASAADCRPGYGCLALGVTAGKGCQPGCVTDTDCPVGDTCLAGRCSFDGGFGGKPDGGPGDPVNPGCTCGAGSSPAAAAALILGAWLAARRRKRGGT